MYFCKSCIRSLCLIALLALSGCGSGGDSSTGSLADGNSTGNASGVIATMPTVTSFPAYPLPLNQDLVTLTLGTQSPISYASGTDILISSSVTSTNLVSVRLCSGVDQLPSCGTRLELAIEGAAAGQSYPVGPGTANTFQFNHDHDTVLYSTASGTITLTGIGSPVKGSLSVLLSCVSGCSEPLTLTGTFSVRPIFVTTIPVRPGGGEIPWAVPSEPPSRP